MQAVVRAVAGFGALALITIGILQPTTQEPVWLLCLWAAAPLLGLLIWLSQPPLPRGLNRGIYNLGMVIMLGFVLIGLQLLRQQFVQAEAIYNRVEIDSDSGQITSNVRPVLASQRVIRGGMFDRTNAPLVSSEVVGNGFARRSYPVIDLLGLDPAAFSNVAGFFSTRYGQSGLEATFSEYLSGERGSAVNQLRSDVLGEPQLGNDLFLTIHAQLQARAYALLGGRRGSVVVLDPQSGQVLALASSPGFDPRALSFNYAAPDWQQENARIAQSWESLNSDAAGQPLLNRPVQGQYPPGSTFKTVTAIALLEHAATTEPDTIRCPDEFVPEAGAPPVVNAVRDGLASLTGDPSNLERVYAYSCNTAFAQYALRLGTEAFTEQAEQLDFYAPLDAPSVYPNFPDLAALPSRLAVEPGFLGNRAALAATGYGQGQLLVTPLQMAMVAAAIANDGVLMQPYLVQRVTRPDGSIVLERQPTVIRRAMSAQTAARMRDNMAAVGEYGFGSNVNQVPGVQVGGKSGTGEHVPGATPHAWFIAIAPVDNPRYAVSVMIESGGEGSSVGGELAAQVLAAAFALDV